MNTPISPTKLSAEDPATYPLDELDISLPRRFQDNSFWPFFERMRNEDPVHYCKDSIFGPYWSITKFDDIMQVDKDHETFSSDDGITLADRQLDFNTANFIAMDPPKHDVQRRTVQGSVAPRNLAEMEGTIRSRVIEILENLPVGETFDWVERVSVELTTQMLATLFDFPFEHRSKLTWWSDMATSGELSGGPTPEVERRAALMECLEWFTELKEQRSNQAEPAFDLVSMLANGKDTKNMDPMEYLGNLILLIVGGNDTTRNSLSGGVLALNQNPAEYEKLRNDHSLIPNMVSEILRWQTPLAYMRRTATRDVELRGKQIKKGDKLAMWYVSGNRDADAIDNPDEFRIDRANARHHLAFGFGIHRCMGNRLAEMQLRVAWEEIVKRFKFVEVMAEPERVQSSFVKGYMNLPVRVHRV